MKRKTKIFIFAVGLMTSLVFLVLSGCGGDDTSTTAFVCDQSAPSLIPPPSGKPQHIYFYRDT